MDSTAPATVPAGLVQQLIAHWPAREEIYAFLALDTAGTVLWMSPAAEQMLGYHRQQLIGRPFSVLFTEADHAKGLDAHELTIARHVGFSEDDRWHVRRDGTRVWINGVATAVRDNNDCLLGFAKVMRDRTDLKAQLVTLQNRIAIQNQASQERFEADQTMVHEQANVVNALSSAVQLLARTRQATPSLVDMLERQVGVLTRLLSDFRSSLQPGASPPALVYEQLDVAEALKEVAHGVRAEAEASAVRLQTLMPSGHITLEADRARLQQVIHNLLINAIKYTPAGGTVWLKATVEGEHVAIRVEDNGVGIDGDMLPKIFDLFTQESRSQHLARGGSGIGLAVVKRWVDAHGGTVEVRSEGPGQGADFTVRLSLQRMK